MKWIYNFLKELGKEMGVNVKYGIAWFVIVFIICAVFIMTILIHDEVEVQAEVQAEVIDTQTIVERNRTTRTYAIIEFEYEGETYTERIKEYRVDGEDEFIYTFRIWPWTDMENKFDLKEDFDE